MAIKDPTGESDDRPPESRFEKSTGLFLADSGKLLRKLAERHEVRVLAFGKKSREVTRIANAAAVPLAIKKIRQIRPASHETNVSGALRHSLSVVPQPSHVIILSDGIANTGPNYLEAAKFARDRKIPIHVAAVGDPRGIEFEVFAPSNVFLKDSVRFLLAIEAFLDDASDGIVTVRLRRKGGKTPLVQKRMRVRPRMRQKVELPFVADRAGVQDLIVQAELSAAGTKHVRSRELALRVVDDQVRPKRDDRPNSIRFGGSRETLVNGEKIKLRATLRQNDEIPATLQGSVRVNGGKPSAFVLRRDRRGRHLELSIALDEPGVHEFSVIHPATKDVATYKAVVRSRETLRQTPDIQKLRELSKLTGGKCVAVSKLEGLLASIGVIGVKEKQPTPKQQPRPLTPLQTKIDAAIARGVAFLLSKQKEDGSFSSTRFGPLASTALAVDAILAAGYKPGVGKEGKAVLRGLKLILKSQAKSGLFRQKGANAMYVHGVCTCAVAASMKHELPKDVKQASAKALEKAVLLIMWAQIREKKPNDKGGWRYTPTAKDSDLSVTVWQVLALKAAQGVGVKVYKQSFAMALDFTKRCAHKEGFRYTLHTSLVEPTMTAAGAFILSLCGEDESKEFKRAVSWLIRRGHDVKTKWMLVGAPFTASVLLKGGKGGRKYLEEAYLPLILKLQSKDGSWGKNFGVRYGAEIATSLAIATLGKERAARAKPGK